VGAGAGIPKVAILASSEMRWLESSDLRRRAATGSPDDYTDRRPQGDPPNWLLLLVLVDGLEVVVKRPGREPPPYLP
jgi:hypothetical protein